VLSAVIWRTWLLRLTAIPLAAVGLYGAASGPAFNIAVAANGDALAIRGADGALSVLGHRPSLYDAEQWLRADADRREPRAAVDEGACDRIGCVGVLPDGRAVALVLDKSAFAEDCLRADVVVTPLYAPPGYAASLVVDREKLKATGAVLLTARGRVAYDDRARPRGGSALVAGAPKPTWGKASSDAASATTRG
jgi:competence protein ComEC